MGFDFNCLTKVLGLVKEVHGARGKMNYMDLGLKLIKLAGPYVVQYIGTVNRPPRVEVEEAFQQAEEAEGFKPWEAPVQKSGMCRALFIGINYYGTRAELSGCCNDVKQVLATLQKKRFPIDEMCILVDEEDFPGATGLPTRSNIVRYMAWLVKDAKAGDVLFMHFSGHGTQTRALQDSDESFDQCIAPLDFERYGCILDDDIFKILLGRLPAGVRFTVVFDCCHSGTMLDLPYTFMGSRSLRSGVTGHMQRIRRGNTCEGDVLMISGCADEQTSADVTNTATLGMSTAGAGGAATQCLTYVILKEGNLSYHDMLIATRDMLRKKRFTQVPQLSASKPIDLQRKFSLVKTFDVDHAVV
ncbi:metacaspase [Trypanosoma rangeli]|uniref:Metacaspase n=1 Tax=Trypanosoma rangeli TaxID=5698 RepID=A0A422N5J3_TRYRA|nr:metacaspase [Trypanosoma rangeli]RNF00747.1 metacaspase [Trypanosoma rangeli]|eukprot:RNF00747.1 metacaspase [Trypanosoma rangeli]